MAVIVITSHGTAGDHLPYIALASELNRRGHWCVLAFNESMHDHALKAGFEVRSAGLFPLGSAQAADSRDAWNHWPSESEPKQRPQLRFLTLRSERVNLESMFESDLRQRVEGLLAVCEGADLLITSTQQEAVGALVHKALGIPWIGSAISPFLVSNQIPSKKSLSDPRERMFRSALRRVEKGLGFQRGTSITAGYHPELLLLASSKAFGRPYSLGYLGYKQSSLILQPGFWFFEPETRSADQNDRLRHLIESDAKPLVLSFSSLPVRDARDILSKHISAARLLGRTLIVQEGWAGFGEHLIPPMERGDDIIFTRFISQDWLFRHSAAVIHHGGIGTLARALRNGAPMLIQPYGNDQFFNARRAVELGVAAAVNPNRLSDVDLANVLEKKVFDPAMKQRAESLGSQISRDKGESIASDHIEDWLEIKRFSRLSFPAASLSASPLSCMVDARDAVDHACRLIQMTDRSNHVFDRVRFWHALVINPTTTMDSIQELLDALPSVLTFSSRQARVDSDLIHSSPGKKILSFDRLLNHDEILRLNHLRQSFLSFDLQMFVEDSDYCGPLCFHGGLFVPDETSDSSPLRHTCPPFSEPDPVVHKPRVELGRNHDKIALSLDRSLQNTLQQFFYRRQLLEGSVLVMEPHTGEILAFAASQPTGTTPSATDRMSVDSRRVPASERNPDHPALAARLPASIFKLITATAAIESGLLDGETTLPTYPHLDFGKWRLDEWNGQGFGRLSIVEALGVSSNTFFAPITAQLGVDQVCKFARAFGFGVDSGVGLIGDEPGFVDPPPTKDPVDSQAVDFYQYNLANFSIGLSGVAVTPLQIALLLSSFCNGGYLLKPTYYSDRRLHANKPIELLSSRSSSLITQGLRFAIQHGTGAALDIPQLPATGGKSGSTSKHSWFAAYAPYDKPEVVVVAMTKFPFVQGNAMPALLVQAALKHIYNVNSSA